MKRFNLSHKALAILALPLMGGVGGGLVSCEDYTEKNFGSRDELYQSTQVNNLTVDLTDAHYAAVAAEPSNIAAAEADGVSDRLAAVAIDKCFNAAIAPEDYLLPLVKTLVGNTPYYTVDAGSTLTVICKATEQLNPNTSVYIPATGAFKEGSYLIVPQGQKQPLANSGTTASGDHSLSGLIYQAGTEKCPSTATIVDDIAFVNDAITKGYLYNFEKDKLYYRILNPAGYYLYLDDTHTTFQYTDDLENDCEDINYALWQVTMSTDGALTIVNVGTGKQIYFDTDNCCAGCYDVPTTKHTGLTAYRSGKANPLQQSVIFGYNGTEWSCKADYINQPLTGVSSVDAESVYSLTGWSFENTLIPSELTYVWKLDATYGLRASSYKSKFYEADSWAISPAINLKKAKKPLLTFDEAQKYGGTPLSDYLKVYVSTDYTGRGAQATATWTEVTDQLEGTRSDGSSWDYMPISLDLTPWAGQPNLRIAFRYIAKDNFAATWEVKNIICKEAE